MTKINRYQKFSKGLKSDKIFFKQFGKQDPLFSGQSTCNSNVNNTSFEAVRQIVDWLNFFVRLTYGNFFAVRTLWNFFKTAYV